MDKEKKIKEGIERYDANFTRSVLHIIAEHEAHDDLWWKMEDQQPRFFINCNDIFWWGTSDAEEITPANLHMLDQAYKDSPDFGGLLFCARVRGMRPQGAAYDALGFSEKDAEHFDAAGPEREVDIGNPCARSGEWQYPKPTGKTYTEYRKEWKP